MEHLTNPVGFLLGAAFVFGYFWVVSMGETQTQVGALRFDEHPIIFSCISGAFLTIGLLSCAMSTDVVQNLSFVRTLERGSAQSQQMLAGTWLLCSLLTGFLCQVLRSKAES